MEETAYRRDLWFVVLAKYSDDQMSNNEMGKASYTYWRGGGSWVRGFGGEFWGKLGRPRRRWKDNIKVYLPEIAWDMDRIDLGQNREKWWAFVKMVMKL